jgi:putative ABC transport system permease protein
MQKQMIIAGLKARPVRTSVSILAVALEVTLIVVIIGLVTGLVSEKAARTMGVGAEITVQPSGGSIFMELSGNTLPLALADKLMQEVPDIKAIAPIQLQINTKDGIETVFGIDPKSWDAVTGGLTFHSGHMFTGPNEVVVDNVWARSHVPEAKVGDTVEVLNHKYKVSGIVEQGKGARVYMSWDAASLITGQMDHFAVFYVKLKNPDAVKQVKHQIEAIMPDNKVSDINDLVSLMTSAGNIPGLNQFMRVVIFIALAIGVLVIFLSMYTTITERTREIGILRSLGASKAYIVSLIFQEAALISILGVIFGVGVSFLLRRLILSVFPTLVVDITSEWLVRASVLAILSGIIGAFYPSLKAAGQDPVEALAYE